ncbi:hypothetical protein L9F63_005795, partial [Diploptera punctata]
EIKYLGHTKTRTGPSDWSNQSTDAVVIFGIIFIAKPFFVATQFERKMLSGDSEKT